MIPVELSREPAEFNKLVRVPGLQFLRSNPRPTREQWDRNNYWRGALPHMRIVYDRICAYCATRILTSTGGDSVDHFVPKAKRPDIAYEWTNFRYASIRFNQRKGTKEVLDPCSIEYGWFILDFDTFLIKPAPDLGSDVKERVQATINELKLNIDPDLVNERMELIRRYHSGMDFETLKWLAPFMAYELERQMYILNS